MGKQKHFGGWAKPILLLGFLSALSGSAYFGYQVKQEHEALALVRTQLKQTTSMANALQGKLKTWQRKLEGAPEYDLGQTDKTALMVVAALRDRAAAHGVTIAGLKIGGGSGVVRRASDIRTSMTTAHDQDAGIRGIDVEIQTSWQSLGDLEGYLADLSRQPVVVREMAISANAAVIKLRIIGV